MYNWSNMNKPTVIVMDSGVFILEFHEIKI